MKKYFARSLFKYIIFLLCSVWLAGCAQFGSLNPNPDTGEFPTFGPRNMDAIFNKQDINTNYFRPMVYIKMNLHGHYSHDEFEHYLIEAFSRFGFFKNVVTRMPTVHINTKPHWPQVVNGELWTEAEDPLTTEKIVDRIGHRPFLIAEVSLRQLSAEKVLFQKVGFSLRFIDPRNNQVLFYARNNAYDFFGLLNYTVVNPVLNVGKQWLYHYARG